MATFKVREFPPTGKFLCHMLRRRGIYPNGTILYVCSWIVPHL